MTQTPPATGPHSDATPLDRRDFLKTVAGGAGALSLLALAGCLDPARRQRVKPTEPPAAPKSLSPAEWKTLEAAQDRLLPSEPDAPGARDVNAIGYLDAALLDPDTDPDTVTLVKDGAARLDRIAKTLKAKTFADLSPERRDEALTTLRTVVGSDVWFTVVLKFTLEAFLGDPVHGGNPNEIGWKWAEHKPGFPRPGPLGKAAAR